MEELIALLIGDDKTDLMWAILFLLALNVAELILAALARKWGLVYKGITKTIMTRAENGDVIEQGVIKGVVKGEISENSKADPLQKAAVDTLVRELDEKKETLTAGQRAGRFLKTLAVGYLRNKFGIGRN